MAEDSIRFSTSPVLLGCYVERPDELGRGGPAQQEGDQDKEVASPLKDGGHVLARKGSASSHRYKASYPEG